MQDTKMNRNNFITQIAIVAMLSPMAMFAQDTTRVQCTSMTKSNTHCKNLAIVGRNLCWQHDSTYVKPPVIESTVCVGTKKDGTKCSLRTKHASGLCYHHREQ